MKLILLLTGKTDQIWIRDGIAEYSRRISKYIRFESEVLPEVRNRGSRPAEWVKAKEAEKILSYCKKDDHVVILDEHGTCFSTLEFAEWLKRTTLLPAKRVLFVIGGAYGFDHSVAARADQMISLSRLTFSHQLVRLLFAEQLYRILSVNAGDPYHHE